MKNLQIEDIYLLAPMQQGILFHTILAQQADPYFVQTSYTIRGELNAAALAAAGQAVLEQHPVLRATPVWEGRAKPVQIVWRDVKLPFQLYDWRDLTADEQQQRFDSLLLEDFERGFTLLQPPLMRHALARLSDHVYKYILSHHHLLLDGWSSAVVMKEMLLAYEALSHNRCVDFETRRPFRDYINWLRQQDLSAAENYWRAQLEGFRTPTSLGMKRWHLNGNRSTSPETGWRDGFGEERYLVDHAVNLRLEEFARSQHVTLNTLAQSAWALLLSCYSGDADILFGAVVSGRPAELEGAESMVGLFINTLPVRIRVMPGMRLGEWLREVQSKAAEARRYEYSPLAAVQRWSEIKVGSPLFESLLVFENYPMDKMLQERIGDLTISEVRGRERTGYPLTLIIGTAGEKLSLLAIYDQRRFDPALVKSMLRHFKTLLVNMIGNSQRRVEELTLLSEAERSVLLSNPNGAIKSSPATITELFKHQVRRTPDSVAVNCGDEQLTYCELDERAEHLARELQRSGIGPESLVAVLLDRSVELVVVLLGILKAGAAYVPLDPSYPQERIDDILGDSQSRLLITRRSLAQRVPEQTCVLWLDDQREELAANGAGKISVDVTGDNLAYVIYTSGSTGRPKGVLITHANVTRLLDATRHWFEFGERDVWALFFSYAFDFSVWEMWGALLHGGRLVVVPHLTNRSPELFRELLRRENVTVLNQTASAFLHLMLVDGSRERVDLPALRLIIFGGETLDFHSLKSWFADHGDEKPKLVNMYGITETTVHVTYRVVTADDVETMTGSMIGREMPDLRLYILDQHCQLVPAGVPGEMYVGGQGLARGYLNRPALTAQRFIPDPFSTDPSARLYRTGDLARHLPDGDIEYLGRLDHQVKIRGYRVELGEIEAVVSRHPAIREAVVLARDAGGEQSLVAYLVCHGQANPTVTELRVFLQSLLPDYMVPSSYVFLDSLPLTTNGKVDRQALPKPYTIRPNLEETFVAPTGAVESALAEIWAQVLGLERVGVHDNFFDLGGHSLLLMQLHGKLNEMFQTDISLVELFEYSTVYAQAKWLSKQGSATAETAGLEEQAQKLRNGRQRFQQQRTSRQSAL
jgi:amino acid adenylation domain-containing protein